MPDTIGISEDRLHHIIGVARKAYTIALERGHDKEFAKKCFMLGWLHDVGYEFAETKEDHPKVSGRLLLLLQDESPVASDLKKPSIKAIMEHGLYPTEKTEEWIILNQADMQIGPDGREMTISERLEDIKNRFGEWSDTYLTACDIAYQCGLTVINLSGNEV